MIVLDTHTLIWWVTGQTAELGRVALETIEAELPDGEILVSSITAWEIALLIARRRPEFTSDVAAWLAMVAQIPGLRFVPVDNAIAIAAVNLPGELHGDPADRMIAATARSYSSPIVTRDKKLRAYAHVRTIW